MNDTVMGRKGNWLSSIKKALSPSSKEKKSQVLHCVFVTIINNYTYFHTFFFVFVFYFRNQRGTLLRMKKLQNHLLLQTQL